MSFIDRVKNAWNAFSNKDPMPSYYSGSVSSSRPDRFYLMPSNEQSIINSIITRVSIDCAAVQITHAKVDENGSFIEKIDSPLNECLGVEANRDQAGRFFMQDVVTELLDEGCVAIVPVLCDVDKRTWYTNANHIYELRCGKILQWYPDRIRVRIYNERTNMKEEKIFYKNMCAIVENPLYAVMNAPNSTFKRLTRTWNILDKINSDSTSGKLDLLVQVPYSFKNPMAKARAEERRKDIEDQLEGSKYGIGYIDQAEKVIQLNRPLENNLQAQIEYLTTQLYGQLGLTDEVLKGTADDKVMTNYYNRTVEPILAAIAGEMTRKFLTKTARTQGQKITFINNPFKLVSITTMGDLFDKLSKGGILTPNEIRSILGFKPVNNGQADQLINANIKQDPNNYGGEDPNDVDQDVPIDDDGNPIDMDQEIQNGQGDVNG